MPLRLTPIIGSYAPTGMRDMEPKDPRSLPPSLAYLRASGESIYVRCRPLEEMAEAPSPLKASLASLLSQMANGDVVGVVMGHVQRGGPNDFYRKQEPVVRRFPVGRAVEVTVDVALRVLNTYPYCCLFEEVDGDEICEDAQPQPQAKPTTQSPPKKGKDR